jgi:uncharacterized protein YcbX
MQISALYIYPIKSLAGIALPSASLTPRGLAYDRRWMLLGPEGQFLTQREYPELTLLQPEMRPGGLRLSHRTKSLPPLLLPLSVPEPQPRLEVQVWEDTCPATAVSQEADAWFSEALQLRCRLVYMPEDSIRSLNPSYGRPGEMVGFADSCPLLVIGEASLAELNRRLPAPVPMNRFRPNIVFTGGEPFAEDGWEGFRIGAASFRGIRPCGRCQLVNVDQDSGQVGKEPLRTLSAFRRQGHKILFGLHANWLPQEGGSAHIQLGDDISIVLP